MSDTLRSVSSQLDPFERWLLGLCLRGGHAMRSVFDQWLAEGGFAELPDCHGYEHPSAPGVRWSTEMYLPYNSYPAFRVWEYSGGVCRARQTMTLTKSDIVKYF